MQLSTTIATTAVTALPSTARVWVYRSTRELSQDEVSMINDKGRVFTSTWAAHGAKLDAAVAVLHDRFIVIAVDEQQAKASGCSIDKSVAFIRTLEKDLGTSLTDRMWLWYEKDSELRICCVEDIERSLKDGELDADTLVFNEMVSTVGDLQQHFRIPLKESWLERYL